MNINEVLPSETLLSTLKRLETRGVVNARGVCKQWLQIIDGNNTFWRILTLRTQTLGEIQIVLQQFDQKSGSTMKKVSFKVEQPVLRIPDKLISFLLNSKDSLLYVSIKLSECSSSIRQRIVESLLLDLPSLVDLRAPLDLSLYHPIRTEVSRITQSPPVSLQVLEMAMLGNLPSYSPNLFQTLAYLHVGVISDHLPMRKFLEPCSKH